ncbi:hypothetical protein KIN20_022312 [Parelaphostrongylus tenuis]|uniref:Uncharacterized protein n=1 Tax=Parelaphostrongylus tenuis TaxID=148309 RepID=A0AAD5QS65_PARTN|nr:hypothetical protein KIN20_022312 [Parelaphostrongylus tenuis]
MEPLLEQPAIRMSAISQHLHAATFFSSREIVISFVIELERSSLPVETSSS